MKWVTTAPTANRRIKYIVLPLVALLLLIPSLLMYWTFSRESRQPRLNDGESRGLRYTHSHDKIYLNIPFQGYYLLQQADAASFHALKNGSSNPLAEDKHAVYCGSQVIPLLRPATHTYLSQGYISDGEHTYFCSNEQDNPDYRWWHEIVRDNHYDSPQRPRKRDYRLLAIDDVNTRRLTTWGYGYLSDGTRLFYDGVPIPGADGATVDNVPDYLNTNYTKERPSQDYLRDAHAVYYRGEQLPGAHPEQFFSFTPESAPLHTHYGQDRATGRFYSAALPFPDSLQEISTAGLQLLLADRKRANHELFINSQGIFYWDYRADALKYACENPFIGDVPTLSLVPGVWADEHITLITRAREVRIKRRSSGRLVSRNTDLLLLPGIGRRAWRKIEALPRAGSVWQAGEHYYFAPNAGYSNGFDDAMYRLADYPAFKQAVTQSPPISPWKLRERYLRPLDKSDHAIRLCDAVSSYDD